MSSQIISSYVYNGDRLFFVSTINRASSATHALGAEYSETIAWECDATTKERKWITFEDSGPPNGIGIHFAVCRRMHELPACEVPHEP